MKRVSPYLKMRVLGAIEYAPGASIIARIRHVAETPFTDENGVRFQFHVAHDPELVLPLQEGRITTMHPRTRSDRGVPRKMSVAEVAEAIEQARRYFRDGKPRNVTAVYRVCIEHGLIQRAAIAPNTFRRVVKANGLVQPERPDETKQRLAFAKASVLADNTFSFRRCRFEAPRDLRSRKIQIRFDRRRPEHVAVFYKGERMGSARAVDFIANDRKPRAHDISETGS